MVFNAKTWVDVPDESNPPVGAPATSAAELNRLEQGIVDAHAHLAEQLVTHGGVIIYVEASTVPPANPPTGLLWHQTDGVKRDLRNIGTPAAPVWEDVTRDKLVASDLVKDYVVGPDDFLPTVPAPASRTASVPAGQAYVIGRRVAKAAQSLTFAKAQDTYVDLDRDGNYVLAPVANGAAAPALTANSIRLFRAVTDADVAQVDTVTVATVTNSAIYTVRINGVDISYTSDATATAGEIALGLVAAINNSTDPNVTPVTAATTATAASTTASLTITADVAGTPFTATVSANLTIANTTANNAAKITAVADLRTTNPTIRGDVSGGGGHTIQDEGVALTARKNLNFVGAGVTVTDDATNNQTDVTIPGGGGGTQSGFRAYQTTGQFTTAGAFAKVVYQTESYDNLGEYDPATSTFTVQVAGTYALSASCGYLTVPDGARLIVAIFVGGIEVKRLFDIGQGRADNAVIGSASVLRFAAGDAVTVHTYTSHSLETSARIDQTSFEAARIGA